MLAIAVLGPLAWMQNMYTAPIGAQLRDLRDGCSRSRCSVPVGPLIFNWIATLWGGALELRAATLFALGAICDDGVRARAASSPTR